MNNQNQVGEFPLQVLPEPLPRLIQDIYEDTQAPIGVIVSAVLAAMSLACQDSFDVQPKENLRFAASLYLIVLAESGERKSAVVQLVMKAIYKLQNELDLEFIKSQEVYLRELALWQIKEKALGKAISKDAEKGLGTKELEEAWYQCQEQKPIAPTQKRLVLSDVTSAAIKQVLGKDSPSLMLASDEAGSFLSGELFRDTAINSMWSGHSISIERVASTRPKLVDYRLGLMLMVQPGLFNSSLERQGERARASGFLARCLICEPQSTQGQRFHLDKLRFRAPDAVDHFHQRVEGLLKGGFRRRERGIERKCLKLTPEAASRWNQQYVAIELSIGPLGKLNQYRDYASKFMEHVSRIAAVLEGFCTPNAEFISDQTMYAAITIAHWFFEHFIQQMKKLDKSDEPSNADILRSWLARNVGANGGAIFKKNDIRKFCPNKLRSKQALDAALSDLIMRGCVSIYKQNRTTLVHYHMGSLIPPTNTTLGGDFYF